MVKTGQTPPLAGQTPCMANIYELHLIISGEVLELLGLDLRVQSNAISAYIFIVRYL
ncbi:hypothetical protein ES703_14833 [subsurface metagenome]